MDVEWQDAFVSLHHHCIVTLLASSTVRVTDIDTGTVLRTLPSPDRAPWCCISACPGDIDSVLLFDAFTGKLHELNVQTGACGRETTTQVRVNVDQKLFYTEAIRQLRTVRMCTSDTHVAISENKSSTFFPRHSITVLEYATGRQVAVINGDGTVASMKFTPGGGDLFVANRERFEFSAVRRYNMDGVPLQKAVLSDEPTALALHGRELLVGQAHRTPIVHVDFWRKLAVSSVDDFFDEWRHIMNSDDDGVDEKVVGALSWKQLGQADIAWHTRQGPGYMQTTAEGGMIVVYDVLGNTQRQARVIVTKGLALRLAWMAGVVRRAQIGVPFVRVKRSVTVVDCD